MRKQLSLSTLKIFTKIEDVFGYLNDEFGIDVRKKETLNLFFSSLIDEGFEVVIYGSKIMNYIKETDNKVNDIDFLIFNSLYEFEYGNTTAHTNTEIRCDKFVDIVKRSFDEKNIKKNYPFFSLKINEIFDINYFYIPKNQYSYASLGRLCGDNWLLKINKTRSKVYQLKLDRAWNHSSGYSLGSLDEIFNPFIKSITIKRFQEEFDNRIINHCYKLENKDVIKLILKNLLFYNNLHVQLKEFNLNHNPRVLKLKQNIKYKSQELHDKLDFFSLAFLDKIYCHDFSGKLNEIIGIYKEIEQTYILISPDFTSADFFNKNVKNINDLSYIQLNKIQNILLRQLKKQIFLFDGKLTRLDVFNYSSLSLSSTNSSLDSYSGKSKSSADLDMTSSEENSVAYVEGVDEDSCDSKGNSANLVFFNYDISSDDFEVEGVEDKASILYKDKNYKQLNSVRNINNLKKEKEKEIYLKLESLQFLYQINEINTLLDTFIKENDLKKDTFVTLKRAIEIKKENLNLYYGLELYKYLQDPKTDSKQASLIAYMKTLRFSHQKLESLNKIKDKRFSSFQQDYYERKLEQIFSNPTSILIKKLNLSGFNEFKITYKVLTKCPDKTKEKLLDFKSEKESIKHEKSPKRIGPSKLKDPLITVPTLQSDSENEDKIKKVERHDFLEEKESAEDINKINADVKSFFLMGEYFLHSLKFLHHSFYKNIDKSFQLLVRLNVFLFKSSINGICEIRDFVGSLKSTTVGATKLIDENPNNIPAELALYKKDLNDIFYIVDVIEKSKADVKTNMNYTLMALVTWVAIMGAGMKIKEQNSLSKNDILSAETETEMVNMIFSNYSHLITVFLFIAYMNLKYKDILSFYEGYKPKLNAEIKECLSEIKLIEDNKNLSFKQKGRKKHSLYNGLESKIKTFLEKDKDKAYFKKIINSELKKETISKETLNTFEI